MMTLFPHALPNPDADDSSSQQQDNNNIAGQLNVMTVRWLFNTTDANSVDISRLSKFQKYRLQLLHVVLERLTLHMGYAPTLSAPLSPEGLTAELASLHQLILRGNDVPGLAWDRLRDDVTRYAPWALDRVNSPGDILREIDAAVADLRRVPQPRPRLMPADVNGGVQLHSELLALMREQDIQRLPPDLRRRISQLVLRRRV